MILDNTSFQSHFKAFHLFALKFNKGFTVIDYQFGIYGSFPFANNRVSSIIDGKLFRGRDANS
jgi:hypothetical protein